MIQRVYTVTIAIILLLAVQVKSQEFELSDQFFVSGLDNYITHSEVINGELYIGGDFEWYNGEVNLNSVAKWTGDKWEPVGTGFKGGATFIYDFEWFEGELYAAGYFEENGIGLKAYSVAKLVGDHWMEVGAGFNSNITNRQGAVHRLFVFNDELYAGGDFDYSGGVDLKNIAKWDGESWQPDGFFDGLVRGFDVIDGQLIAFGNFESYVDSVENTLPEDLFTGSYYLTQSEPSKSVAGSSGRNGWLFDGNNDPVWIDLKSAAFNPFVEGSPRSFEIDYLPTFGGFSVNFTISFNDDSTVTIPTTVTGVACSSIGIVFDTAPDSLGSYDPSDDSEFSFGIIENSSLDCGAPADTIRFTASRSAFKTKTNIQRINNVAIKNNATWNSINLSESVIYLNNAIVYQEELLAFGLFNFDGDTVSAVSWNGEGWQALEEQPVITYINDSKIINNELYVTGSTAYTHFSDEAVLIQKWDGSNWTSYSDILGNSAGRSLVSFDNKIIVAGIITSQKSENLIRNIVTWDGTKFIPFDNPKKGLAFNSYSYDITLSKIRLLPNGELFLLDRFIGDTDTTYAHAAILQNDEIISLNEYLNAVLRGDISDVVELGDKIYLSSTSGFFVVNGDTSSAVISVDKESKEIVNIQNMSQSFEIDYVTDLEIWDNKIIATGGFSDKFLDEEVAGVAKWENNEWEILGNNLEIRGGELQINDQGELLLADKFVLDNSEYFGIAKFVPSSNNWISATPNLNTIYSDFNSYIETFVIINDELYLSGKFQKDSELHLLIKIKNSEVENIDLNHNFSIITALEVHEGKFYFSGREGFYDTNLYSYDLDENELKPLFNELRTRYSENPFNGKIYDLQSTKDGMYFAGNFDVVNGLPMNNLGVINYIPVSNELDTEISQFYLHQNYPNPFNPSTVISFQLAKSQVTRLKVYDLLGREVVELINEQMPSGAHQVNFDAGTLASGVYIYRLEAGNQVLTRKMMLIK